MFVAPIASFTEFNMDSKTPSVCMDFGGWAVVQIRPSSLENH